MAERLAGGRTHESAAAAAKRPATNGTGERESSPDRQRAGYRLASDQELGEAEQSRTLIEDGDIELVERDGRPFTLRRLPGVEREPAPAPPRSAVPRSGLARRVA